MAEESETVTDAQRIRTERNLQRDRQRDRLRERHWIVSAREHFPHLDHVHTPASQNNNAAFLYQPRSCWWVRLCSLTSCLLIMMVRRRGEGSSSLGPTPR